MRSSIILRISIQINTTIIFNYLCRSSREDIYTNFNLLRSAIQKKLFYNNIYTSHIGFVFNLFNQTIIAPVS